VLVCSERKVCWLVAGGWFAGGWFVLREKYCWPVADKPSQHGVCRKQLSKLFQRHPLFFISFNCTWIAVIVVMTY
jgi:hypothetical protein